MFIPMKLHDQPLREAGGGGGGWFAIHMTVRIQGLPAEE